jgi:hypothetical protein
VKMNIPHLFGAGRSFTSNSGTNELLARAKPKLRQINRIFSVLFKLILDPEE